MAVITVNTRTAATATGNIVRTIAIAIGTKRGEDCKKQAPFSPGRVAPSEKRWLFKPTKGTSAVCAEATKGSLIFFQWASTGICDAGEGALAVLSLVNPLNPRGTPKIITAR